MALLGENGQLSSDPAPQHLTLILNAINGVTSSGNGSPFGSILIGAAHEAFQSSGHEPSRTGVRKFMALKDDFTVPLLGQLTGQALGGSLAALYLNLN